MRIYTRIYSYLYLSTSLPWVSVKMILASLSAGAKVVESQTQLHEKNESPRIIACVGLWTVCISREATVLTTGENTSWTGMACSFVQCSSKCWTASACSMRGAALCSCH